MSSKKEKLPRSSIREESYFDCLVSRRKQWRSLNLVTNMFILYFLVYFDFFGLVSLLSWGGYRAQVLSVVAIVGILAVFVYESFYLCPYRVHPADCDSARKKLDEPFYVYNFTEKKEVPRRWSLRVLVPLFLAVLFASAVSIWEVVFCPWIECGDPYNPSVFAVFLTLASPSFFSRIFRVILSCLW